MVSTPHGGKLINKVVKKDDVDFDNIDYVIDVDNDQLSEIQNIAHGLYSPLEGYMNEDDFNSVVESMKLADGTPWSIPVFLPVSKEESENIKIGSQIQFKLDGKDFAIMTVENKFEFDRDKFNKNVYGTTDSDHPGVARINSISNIAIGGEIYLYEELPKLYPEFEQTPLETREIFKNNGWDTVVGFQTRNPAHKAHEYVQKLCLEFVDGLFVNPIIGKKKAGDFKDEVILAVYKELTDKFYPKNSTHLAVYKSRMNYAGPREAVFHAIVRKNFGCTHFIVGRDHAGVGDYYDKLAAHKIFDEIENLGVQIMKVSAAFYDKKTGSFTTEKTSVPDNSDIVSISGTKVREYVNNKDYEPLKLFIRDEVLDVIDSFDKPFVE